MREADLEDFCAKLPSIGRVLGLDVGSKTVGVALSDGTRMIASPLKVIERKRFGPVLAELQGIIAEYQIKGLVLGLPINMNGTEGPRCEATRQFAANLLAEIELPLTFWDERMSTTVAEKSMLEADLSRKKRKERIDQAAAAYILQGFLDYAKKN